MGKMCNSCPFNYGSMESDYVQNVGCLRSGYDILKLKDEKNENWMCHSNPARICQGLASQRDTTTGPLHYQPGENYPSTNVYAPEGDQPILLPNPAENLSD